MPSVTIRAYAKINLSLRVLSARADGFHNIRTIFQSIDLFDRVRCERTRGPFRIRCRMPGVPTDRSNLVWMAARQLWSLAGRDGEPRGAVVTLQKGIPMQAGLGGGSSDAAAALLGLRRVWKLRVRDEDLYTIAVALGSDVPYFLVGGTALGLGRGEEVYPLEDLPQLWVLLVLPPFGVSTEDAYTWWDATKGREGLLGDAGHRHSELAAAALPSFLGVPLVNDLESPVIERHPVIGELKRRLQKEGALLAAMSGSGSAVFGVFSSGRVARRAARRFTATGIDVRCVRFRRRQRR